MVFIVKPCVIKDEHWYLLLVPEARSWYSWQSVLDGYFLFFYKNLILQAVKIRG